MKVGTDSIALSSWIQPRESQRILDIGTGTGILALACAQKTETATIEALEIEAAAAAEAQKNFSLSPWSQRLIVHKLALQDFAPRAPYDLILSNPPYFTQLKRSTHPSRRQARHTETLKTTDIFAFAQKHLHSQGTLTLILPDDSAKSALRKAGQYGLFIHSQVLIRHSEGQAFKRVILTWGKTLQRFQREILTLTDGQGHYSDNYLQLTSELVDLK